MNDYYEMRYTEYLKRQRKLRQRQAFVDWLSHWSKWLALGVVIVAAFAVSAIV